MVPVLPTFHGLHVPFNAQNPLPRTWRRGPVFASLHQEAPHSAHQHDVRSSDMLGGKGGPLEIVRNSRTFFYFWYVGRGGGTSIEVETVHSSKMYIPLMCCEGRRDLQRVYTNRMYVPLIYWEGRGTSIEVETVRCTFLQCIRREGGDLHRVGDSALQQDICSSGLLRGTVECKMQFTDFALWAITSW